jgi:nucleoside-diphosphate-sugar epimerase
MKALVTGATGFIGSHLVNALLRQGFDVSCLVRQSSNLDYLDGLAVSLVRGDCNDRASLDAAVKGVDYVFHLAGLTKARSEDNFIEANVEGTQNIINAALHNNRTIKRFFFMSSLAAVGPSLEGKPLTEEAIPAPVSIYGKSKYEAEKAVYSRRHEMPVTIIRPPAVYGPRDRDMLVFFKMVKSGIIPYWGKCCYSLIYVEDLVSCMVSFIFKKEAEGEIFFVSDGTIYSTDDIIGAIAASLGKRPLRVKLPHAVMAAISRIAEVLSGATIINRDKMRELKYTHWICDSAKAFSMLDFQPKVILTEGAKWTADWYRIHRWL